MDDIQKTAMESKENISSLLKAFSHPARIEILSYLYDGSKELANLLDKIDLSKTALMKHLDILIETGIMNRIERGKYEMTRDGKEMFISITSTYRETQIRFKSVQKYLWSKYLPPSREIVKNEVDGYLVNIPAKYYPGWLSFNSSMTGILNSIGIRITNYEVAGYTGSAFFLNVLKGFTCPSGPSTLYPLKDFYEGIKDLGWNIKEYSEINPSTGKDLPVDQKKFELMFNKVKEALKKTNRPVIIWGVPIPEYGIVNGYRNDEYIVATFREHVPEYFGQDNPIRFNEIIPSGRFQLLYFENETEKPSQSIADKNAIERALKMFKQNKYRVGYVSGPEAFEEWAIVLEGDIENVSYHGNSYIGVCALESISLASNFLELLYTRYKSKIQGKEIKKAGSKFKEIEFVLKEFVSIFPFSFDGDLALKQRKKGAELLRTIIPHLKDIEKSFKITHNNWEID
jgi:DNA-binding transcriptional ArsR family regulator